MPQPATDPIEEIELVKALRLTPSSSSAYNRAGRELDRRGQYAAAVRVLRGAVELSPHRSELYTALGTSLYKLGARLEWAVFADQPGRKPAPARVPGDELSCWRDTPPTCFELSGYKPEHVWLAERDYSERITKDLADTNAYLNLGRTMRNRSVAACVSALELNPRSVRAYLTLAHVLPVGGNLGLYRRRARAPASPSQDAALAICEMTSGPRSDAGRCRSTHRSQASTAGTATRCATCATTASRTAHTARRSHSRRIG